MIRNDDAAVRMCCLSKLLSECDIVLHVEGQDRAAMFRGKDELLGI